MMAEEVVCSYIGKYISFRKHGPARQRVSLSDGTLRVIFHVE
jgi:hypothetical protein